MKGGNGKSRWRDRVEWPTLLVALCIYSMFIALTWFHDLLPWWLVLPLGAYVVAWHGSLQHEVVHGHPTDSVTFNRALVFPSLWLWLPFLVYERSHTDHHMAANLTDPLEDPESFYVTAARWQRMRRPARWLLCARNSLTGRLVLGPLESVWLLLVSESGRIRSGDFSHAPAWLIHLAGCAVTLFWVMEVCGIGFWAYVLLYAYPGLSLTLLRSFAEHQANVEPSKRTAIIEANPVLALLFLNNNLHSVHHDSPGKAWYRLPGELQARREEFLGQPDGYRFPGYLAVARAYLLRPKEPVLHPRASR